MGIETLLPDFKVCLRSRPTLGILLNLSSCTLMRSCFIHSSLARIAMFTLSRFIEIMCSWRPCREFMNFLNFRYWGIRGLLILLRFLRRFAALSIIFLCLWLCCSGGSRLSVLPVNNILTLHTFISVQFWISIFTPNSGLTIRNGRRKSIINCLISNLNLLYRSMTGFIPSNARVIDCI